jgi:hypothetical protein
MSKFIGVGKKPVRKEGEQNYAQDGEEKGKSFSSFSRKEPRGQRENREGEAYFRS